MNFFEKTVLVAATCLASQLPFFVDQYDVRLQSHIAESSLVLSKIEAVATSRGKTLNEYIEKFLTSSDQDISSQGKFMQEIVARNSILKGFHETLISYSPLTRPAMLFSFCDSTIAWESLRGMHIGFVASEAGILWTIFGAVVGYAGILIVRRRKKKRQLSSEAVYKFEKSV